MKKTAEVIIIGGGINGCAAAYYLAKAGQKNVIVLEGSDSIGHGQSSRNAGGVRQSGRDARELPYVIYAIKEIWPYLSGELGVDVEYCQGGNLRLGQTPAHMEKLTRLAGNCTNLGLDVRMLDAYEVKQLNPYLSDKIIGASWCPTDGHANPLYTVLGYYRRAISMGVTFYTGAKVVSLKKMAGRIRQVITADGTVFEAPTVILTAGYESRAIANTVGIDLPLYRFFEEALVTENQPHMFDMMLGTADADFYGHQSTHGSFVFGSDCGLEDSIEIGEGDHRSRAFNAPSNCRAVLGYIPALANVRIIRTWGGCIDMCHDNIPIVGPISEVPGLIVAAGLTGHGFGSGPVIGMMLAQMAMEQETVVDMSAFRYERFKLLNQ